MPKRYRTPKMKPNELRIYYGKAEGEGPDVCYMHGPGTDRADSRLLHSVMGCERHELDFQSTKSFTDTVLVPSLFDELKKRGYDLTTIKFSIQKKV